MSRGQRGREYAKAEFAIAVLWVLVALIFAVISPSYMGGGISSESTWSTMLPAAGGAGVVIGFAWMIRIYRTSFNPEPDHRVWRYRARGFIRK